MFCWNLLTGTKHRRWLQKKHCLPLRESPVFRWFCTNLDEKKSWYSSIYKEMELVIDCLTSRRLLQKICSSKFQFCTKVWASSRTGLSSSYGGCVKCKEKVPDVSDSNQNVETKCKKYPHCLVYPFFKIYNYKKEPYEWII